MADHQNDEPQGDDLVDWIPEPADQNDEPQGEDLADWMPEPADQNDQPEGQHPVNWIPEPADHQNDQPQGPQPINWMPEPADQNYQPHGPQPINWMPDLPVQPHVSCPRCKSDDTRFCYFNNYSFSQPRYHCDSCSRYWTHGGAQRDVPVGGSKRAKRAKTDARLSVRYLLVREGVDPETVAYALSMSRVYSAAAFGRGKGIRFSNDSARLLDPLVADSRANRLCRLFPIFRHFSWGFWAFCNR